MLVAAQGKTYQDVTALRDPLAGVTDSFDAPTNDAMTLDYNPYHDSSNGRFTSGGGSGKMGKTKYAPSPQRSDSPVKLRPKTYARLTGTLNTRYPGLKEGEVRVIRDANHTYMVKADGHGGFQALSRKSIK